MNVRPSWAPTAEDLIELNKQITRPQYGGVWPGIFYESGLYSSVERPWASYFGEIQYPSPYDKAAALMEAIINWHVFQNGNKRTALIAGDSLLRLLISKEIQATTKEEVELTEAIEDGRMGVTELAVWLEQHSV